MRSQCQWKRATCLVAVAVCAAGIFAGELGAAVVDGLYSVTVAPENGRGETRQRIIQRGMQQLLVRVTGREDAAVHEDLLPIVERAERYINQYGLSPDGRRYLVGFRASAVNAELVARNWPIWGAERPMTLLWVGVEDRRGERAVLSAEAPGDGTGPELAELMRAVRDEIERVAEQRGLPIMLPALDPEDPWSVSTDDIWYGRYDRIDIASSLYAADAYLVAALSVGDFGLSGEWTLVRDGQQTGARMNALGAGMNWLANGYAAEFSLVGGARNVGLVVENVDSLSDYGRVMRYLESLSVLESVDVAALDGSSLRLELRCRGAEDVLARVLTLDGVLVPSRNSVFLPTDETLPPDAPAPDDATIGPERPRADAARPTLIYEVPRTGLGR